MHQLRLNVNQPTDSNFVFMWTRQKKYEKTRTTYLMDHRSIRPSTAGLSRPGCVEHIQQVSLISIICKVQNKCNLIINGIARVRLKIIAHP